MKKSTVSFLDFEVNKLTHSIENVSSGDSFVTEIKYLTKDNIKQVNKKAGWVFD